MPKKLHAKNALRKSARDLKASSEKPPAASTPRKRAVPPPLKYGPETHDGNAEFLKTWVALLVDDPEHHDATKWEDGLDRLIEDLLEAGADSVLTLALQKATVFNPFTVHELQRHIEAAATRPFVTFKRKQRAALLLAMPVLISQEALPPSGEFFNPIALKALGDSLKRQVLVRPEAHVVVASYLYHSDELLTLTPSQVLRLPQCLLDEGLRRTVEKAILGRTGWPDEPIDDGAHGSRRLSSRLRYLVLTVVEGDRAEVTHEGPVPAAAERRRALIGWHATADNLIAQALGVPSGAAEFVGFESFYEGVRQGAKALQDLALYERLEALFAENNLSPGAVTAVVAAYMLGFDFQEVRLSLVSKLSHTLLTGEVYPAVDDDAAHEAVERMKAVLKSLAIDEPTIVPMPLPMEQTNAGEGPVERVFLTHGRTTDEIVGAHVGDARPGAFKASQREVLDEPETGEVPPRKLH